MNIFSKDRTIISDIINRILNCREIKELYVFGKTGEELAYLYPAIHLIKEDEAKEMCGDVVYIHVTDRNQLVRMLPWIMKEKKTKDFIIYISHQSEISDEDMKLLGVPYYLDKYFGMTGVLFLVGISFQKNQKLMVPENFKVLAIIHFYNEADILEQTILYLLSQEVNIYLLDNWSDDGGYEIARKYQKDYSERIFLERFPDTGKCDNYEWYNQLEKTELLSKNLDYDWFIHYDADEIRMTPWEGISLREAIYWIDRQGYNCIENTVIDFRFTAQNSENIFMKDTFFDFRHQKTMFNQLKTWKKSQKIELKSSGGHFAHIENPKIYPLKFLNRHYPLRNIEQAGKKVFEDRVPRFKKEQGERGWHTQYEKFKNTEDFIFDKSNLLVWHNSTFHELYIPLFLECGLRWNTNNDFVEMSLPDVENKRLILYGAGNIGKGIYLKLVKKNQMVAWVDKQYEQLPAMYCERVVSPQEILKIDYDYIVLAVKKSDLAQDIKKELIEKYNVSEEKILYIKFVETFESNKLR